MVYLIHATGTAFYKIGYTGKSNAKSRLYEMQVGCPHELKLVYAVEGDRTVESDLWAVFRSEWRRGEWFEFDSIDRVIKAFDDFGAVQDLTVKKPRKYSHEKTMLITNLDQREVTWADHVELTNAMERLMQ